MGRPRKNASPHKPVSGRMPTAAEMREAAIDEADRTEAADHSPELREDERGPTVTASVLARHLDLTVARIVQLGNQGLIPRNHDNTFEQGACRIAYIRMVRRFAATRAGTGDKTTALVETKTLKAKLDLAIAQGDYVNINEVEAVLTEAFAALRNELSGLGAGVTRDLELRAKIDAKVNDGIARVRNSLEAAATSAFSDSENDVGDEEAAA